MRVCRTIIVCDGPVEDWRTGALECQDGREYPGDDVCDECRAMHDDLHDYAYDLAGDLAERMVC